MHFLLSLSISIWKVSMSVSTSWLAEMLTPIMIQTSLLHYTETTKLYWSIIQRQQQKGNKREKDSWDKNAMARSRRALQWRWLQALLTSHLHSKVICRRTMDTAVMWQLIKELSVSRLFFSSVTQLRDSQHKTWSEDSAILISRALSKWAVWLRLGTLDHVS